MIKHHTITQWTLTDGKPDRAYEQPESYIHIPMPWKRRMYSISDDDEGIRRPVLAIYWHFPSAGYGCIKIRIGWTCSKATYNLGKSEPSIPNAT